MGFVLDASIALTWCFSDESNEASIALLNRLASETAFVPGIWTLELGNILLGAERRKRLNYAEITQFLALLSNINIRIDNETASKGLHETLSLARDQKLTSYDAAYLELAMRLGLPLASKDNQLLKAASSLGVETISV